jgi:pimeloyl-ACP methyl ester carboxylesterase/uncharacterized protein YceK
MRRSLVCLSLLAVTVALGGCTSIVTNKIAERMVTAPKQHYPQKAIEKMREAEKLASPAYVKHFKAKVGPPAAKIDVAMIAPRNYRFGANQSWKQSPLRLVSKWRVHGAPGGTSAAPSPSTPINEIFAKKPAQARKLVNGKRSAFAKALQQIPVCRPTGTIILIPSYGGTKEQFLGYALDFANHGYRVVLVDLRGQGQSTGNQVTYGLVEHQDISQVIAALYKRKLVAGKLALVGFSEGSVIALDTAAANKHVDAVVAVGPFTNLEQTMYSLIHEQAPGIFIKHGISQKEFAQAFAKAGKRIGRNLADANPGKRVGRIQVPVLYVSGGKDRIAPAVGIRKLAAETLDGRLFEIPRYRHAMLLSTPGKVGSRALEFLDKTMGPSPDPGCLSAPPPKTVRYDVTNVSTALSAGAQALKSVNSRAFLNANPANIRLAVRLPQGIQVEAGQVTFKFVNVTNPVKPIVTVEYHAVPDNQALAPPPASAIVAKAASSPPAPLATNGEWTYYKLNAEGQRKFRKLQAYLRPREQGFVPLTFQGTKVKLAQCGALSGKIPHIIAMMTAVKYGYVVLVHNSVNASNMKTDAHVTCSGDSGHS